VRETPQNTLCRVSRDFAGIRRAPKWTILRFIFGAFGLSETAKTAKVTRTFSSTFFPKATTSLPERVSAISRVSPRRNAKKHYLPEIRDSRYLIFKRKKSRLRIWGGLLGRLLSEIIDGCPVSPA
jgi:hypothetical protein